MTGNAGADYLDGGESRRRPKRPVLCAQGARSLATLIHDEIIPRLVRAHGTDGVRPAGAPGPADVESLARRVLVEDSWTLLADIDRWLDVGVDVPTLLLELLAPTARRLGDFWDEDSVDFVDVTMGMWRLQELVHAIAQRRPGLAPNPGAPRRALFASVPGEQHGFGALVVEELFHRAGWETVGTRPDTRAMLVAAVSERPFDLVGLSVSCDRFVPSLSGLIAAIRRAARNPALIVMVGGPVFTAAPDLADDIGADLTAHDGALAVAMCDARLAAARFASALVA
jgi:methanogenic corrinoid protein MtbC1